MRRAHSCAPRARPPYLELLRDAATLHIYALGVGILARLGITLEDRPQVDEFQLAPLIVDGVLLNSANLSDAARMAVTSVYRGNQILSDLAAQLSWGSFRGGAHTDQAEIRDPERVNPTPQILVDPSPFMSRDDVVRTIVTNLIFRGFAPLYLQNHDAEGRPRFATPVNPDEVQANWNENQTKVIYHWRDRRMIEGFDLAIIEFTRLPGVAKGLGPLDAASSTIAGVKAANDWADTLFINSGIPSGMLTVPGKLTKTEAGDLRDQWEGQHSDGRNTAVLSGGMSYSATSLSADQLEALASRAFGQQEVARLLGIPHSMLNTGSPVGSASNLTYQNVQQVFRELTNVTLYPSYLRRIEEAFTTFLPRGQETIFNLSDFTRADDETRTRTHAAEIAAGIKTVDEVRKEEGLPVPAPGVPDRDPLEVPNA